MSDEFEPALTDGMEPESATGEAPQSDDGDEGEWNAATGTEPSGIANQRRGHVISDKTRELFKAAQKSVKEQLAADGEEDEYEPAVDNPDPITPDPAGAAATPGVTTAPRSDAAPAAPAPSLDPQVQQLKAAYEARIGELETREKSIAAREAASDIGKLHDTYLDKGAAVAIVELVKQFTGATTESELQEEVADLITELSGHSLGVQVPTEIKTRLDAKRALKGVKAHQGKLDKREAAIAEKQQQQENQANIQRAIVALDTEVRKPELAKQYPFLTVEENAGELIFETVEAQLKRDGTEMKWTDAAKRVNDYLEKQWRAAHDKRAHLFTASNGNANGNGSSGERPQGDPQGIRRSHTLTNAAASSSPTKQPEPQAPGKWSPEDHRARTKARMRAAFKPPTQ